MVRAVRMADADMTKGIDHPLIGQNAVGDDQIPQQLIQIAHSHLSLLLKPAGNAAQRQPTPAAGPMSTLRVAHPVQRRSSAAAAAYIATPMVAITSSPAKTSGTRKVELAVTIR